jgi:hypothetical protein
MLTLFLPRNLDTLLSLDNFFSIKKKVRGESSLDGTGKNSRLKLKHTKSFFKLSFFNGDYKSTVADCAHSLQFCMNMNVLFAV